MKAIVLGLALAQACLFTAMTAPTALAQTASATARTSTSTSTAVSSSASTSATNYRCGGIGFDEQKQMKAEAGRHDLMLSFATPRGAYVADVDVTIGNAQGTVVQAHCGGPLMLVDLAPHGRYEVTARANGQTLRKSVTVNGKPATLAFTWPAS